MNPDFEIILEDCLRLRRTGVSLDHCLSLYPEQAEALRPLLLAAAHLHALPIPQARAQAVETGRQRMLATLDRQSWVENNVFLPVSKSGLSRYTERIWKFVHLVLFGKENTGMKFALRFALDIVVLIVVAAAFTLNASASTLPGEPLYGVKQTWQQIRLTLTTNDQARQQLQTQLDAEHRAEVQQLIQLHRSMVVEFDGTLEQMNPDTWVVSGITVNMLPQTTVQGKPAVGQVVWVRASIQSNGQLMALAVQIGHQLNSVPGTSLPAGMPSSTPWMQHESEHTPMTTPGATVLPNSHDADHPTLPSPTSNPVISPTHHDETGHPLIVTPGTTNLPSMHDDHQTAPTITPHDSQENHDSHGDHMGGHE